MQKVSVSPSNGIVFFKKTFSSQKCITRAKTSHPIESVLFAKWVVLFEQLQGKKIIHILVQFALQKFIVIHEPYGFLTSSREIALSMADTVCQQL